MPIQQPQIDAQFPGGNILLEDISGAEVRLRQDLRDTNGDWFYWAFRVRGAAGRQLTFRFTRGNVLAARGPVVSSDGGLTWRWLGREGRQHSFNYEFGPAEDEVLFALCPLYTEATFRRWVKGWDMAPLQLGTLCASRDGMPVELLRLENPNARFQLLLTARHHACETMASFVLEGLLEAFLGGDEIGEWLRTNTEVLAVPFMDTAGVEAGDQGKNRRPYDHNRDYGGTPEDSIYPEVRAWRERVGEWVKPGKIGIALDFHCPWIRDGLNEVLYFVGGPDEAIWQRVTEFSAVLEAVAQGPLPYRAADNLPYGEQWNTLTYDGLGTLNCGRWSASLPGVVLATTLEVPYANASGAEVTPEACREFGKDLALALCTYLASRSF